MRDTVCPFTFGKGQLFLSASSVSPGQDEHFTLTRPSRTHCQTGKASSGTRVLPPGDLDFLSVFH